MGGADALLQSISSLHIIHHLYGDFTVVQGKTHDRGKEGLNIIYCTIRVFLVALVLGSIHLSIRFKRALQRPLESLHVHCKAEQPARGQHEGLKDSHSQNPFGLS